MMLRGPGGSWCGYCGVPNTHPAYGKHYDNVDVSVHGGLTYADKCNGQICHQAQPGMPEEVYWLGMDFAHCGDLSPGMLSFYNRLPSGPSYHDSDIYRNIAYVRAEVEQLAEQLAVLEKTVLEKKESV